MNEDIANQITSLEQKIKTLDAERANLFQQFIAFDGDCHILQIKPRPIVP
jgi:hypothetical protein